VAASASDDFLAQRIDDLRDDMRAGFSDIRDEMRQGFADIRADMRALRARLDTLLLGLIAGLGGVIATLLVKL
jgi:hypothetical protein